VKIIRKNLKENEDAKYVHSHTYEYLISERWYVILEDSKSNQIFDIASVRILLLRKIIFL
jgi:hypothetical protein